MSDSKTTKFDELLSELTTRETSTLTVATVASSASLILLGFPDSRIQASTVLAGFLFPLMGIIYRETTIMSIDASDLRDLEDERSMGAKKGDFRRTKLDQIKQVGQVRRFMLRLLLILPSFLWLGFIPPPPLLADFLIFGCLILLWVLPACFEDSVKESWFKDK
jgi:hypothetical protein